MIDKTHGQTTRRAIRILWILQGHILDGMRLKPVAEALGVPAPTALRDLTLLADEGIVERIPGRDEHWRLTPKIVQVSRAVGEEFARHRGKLDEFEQRYSRDPR